MNRLRWLGIAVIVVAVGGGTLRLLWPQPRPPLVAEADAGPYLVRLKGDPPKVGIGSLTVEILGSAGETPTPEWVRFEPHMPQLGLVSTGVEAVPAGTDDYSGVIDLSAPGQWDVTVRIGMGTDAGAKSYAAVLHVTAER
ncbi:hypothetical protein [Mycobacterium sp. NPDC050441]|uniref:hypothetical protein n=1 Tax=Mycobacterium sp. NPDC050441 TaxID=3155403 RepID=UPI0033CDDD6A